MGALTILSLGLYLPIWFGLTWSEMRGETHDEQMLPLGHALSTLIPGWNAWQAWRHFRVIDQLLGSAVPRARVDPMSGAIGLIIWWLTFTHYSSDPIFLALNAVELFAGTMVVLYGQRALNAYWASRGAEERVTEADLIALGLASVYMLFTIVGFLSPS